MRPILLILLLCSGGVLSQYYEKTRFDRAVHRNHENPISKRDFSEKRWTFVDHETYFAAYKDGDENNCYLEKLIEDSSKSAWDNLFQQQNQRTKILYASTEALTKIEAWRIAGGRIVDFCHGRNIILLQRTKPTPQQTLDPFLNEIPEDENDIMTRRVADVVLTPLLGRAKRQIMLEQREKQQETNALNRSRRQAPQFRGRFRGQTQSQYLNTGTEDQKEGKAEAEATQQSSHAVVSGSRGMGQAQSMSMGGTGCEDCPGYPGYRGEGAPDRLQVGSLRPEDGRYTKIPGTGVGPPGGVFPGGRILYPGTGGHGDGTGLLQGGVPGIPSGRLPGGQPPMRGVPTYPGGMYPGAKQPGGAVPYPGTVPAATGIGPPSDKIAQRPIAGGVGTYPGRYTPTTTGGGGEYPGGVPQGMTVGGGTPGIGTGGTTGGGGTYPSGVATRPTMLGGGVTYPGGVPPGSTNAGGGATYPGGFAPGSNAAGGGVPYPGGIGPGATTTGGGVTYPGGVAPGSITTGGGGFYPGGVAPGSTAAGVRVAYPDGVPPGSTAAGGGVPYPGSIGPGATTAGGGVTYPGGVAPGSTATGGRVTYPGGVPPGSTATGGRVTYPGGVPPGSTAAGGGVPYPGGIGPGTSMAGGGVTYPGGVAPGSSGAGGRVSYPGDTGPRTTTAGGGITYPGGGVSGPTMTGGRMTYPGGVAPESTAVGGGVTYPGGVAPVSTAVGGGVTYLDGVPPGGSLTYPGGGAAGPITVGGGVRYPGSVVHGPATGGGGATYPDGVSPGSAATGGGVTYPSGAPSGPAMMVGGVTYPGGVAPGSTQAGGHVTYPGGITPGTVIGGGGVYPGDTRDRGGTGGFVSGSTTTPEGAMYPARHIPVTGVSGGPMQPGAGATYPGAVLPGAVPEGGGVPYPGGVAPSTVTPGRGATYPGGPVQSPGVYPGGIAPGTVSIGGGGMYPVPYPGSLPGTIAGTGAGVLPDTRGQMPGAGPNIITTSGSTSGASTQVSYPGGPPGVEQVLYPSGAVPSGLQGGHIGTGQPGIAYPPGVPSSGGPPQIMYPGSGVGQMPYPSPGQLYQGQDGKIGKYPEGTGVMTGQIPGYLTQPGQYPGAATSQDLSRPTVTGGVQYPVGTTGGQVPTAGVTGQGVGQYPSTGSYGGQGVGIGQYPGSQYPGGLGTTTGTGEASQYYRQPSGAMSVEDGGAESQASSSVKQVDTGTQASASSQGKFGQGTAQSQVTGTYSGSGSFSAQAGTMDGDKSAQTAVSGGKEGAISNAQGVGGYGKSQAQVQLDSDSGATSTGAQSSGWNHGTNSQVQASSKGGMADAQANGEGSTSSQAQIGFHPYLKTDEKVERQERPFRGGGTASAQSGTHRGQSQSQLEGSFQYGITYTGAAQAGSGSGAASSRKPFSFNVTETDIFKPFTPYNVPTISQDEVGQAAYVPKNQDYDEGQDEYQHGLQTSSSSRKTVIANATMDSSEEIETKKVQTTEKTRSDDTMYDANAEYEEEYEDEDYDSGITPTSTSLKYSQDRVQSNGRDHQQSQMIHVATGNRHDVRVNQDSNAPRVGDMLQPGQPLPGYKIPSGFRARVTSVSGEKTVAQGDGKSQAQTVALISTGPNTTRENKSPITETRSLQTNHERLAEQHSLSRDKSRGGNVYGHQSYSSGPEYPKQTSVPIKPSYYTVTNSVAGKMDSSRHAPRKYEHRYYTKSSTCGYFTFSCNVVYGSNGRTKICKPKMPTYPDGTPMKC